LLLLLFLLLLLLPSMILCDFLRNVEIVNVTGGANVMRGMRASENNLKTEK